MRTALIHDWFDTIGGSEKVVQQILKIIPDADLYSLVDFLNPSNRFIINNRPINTSFIQNLPFSKHYFRSYLPLMPLAIEQFDLSAYDLVISSSHAFAKGVIPIPGQKHISYIHTPIRYAWDLQNQYLKNAGLQNGLRSIIARFIFHYLRIWDRQSITGVDTIIANSDFTAQRIRKIYNRESTIIYPPVDIDSFEFCEVKKDYYVTVTRLVHYKNIDLLIDTFRRLPNKKLFIIGDGPLLKRYKSMSPRNISFTGYLEHNLMVEYLKYARAFIYAAKEDFGIAAVEAQACGTPVIAYGLGGTKESIINFNQNGPTGIHFMDLTIDSITEAINLFEENRNLLTPINCKNNASKFHEVNFREQLLKQIH